MAAARQLAQARRLSSRTAAAHCAVRALHPIAEFEAAAGKRGREASRRDGSGVRSSRGRGEPRARFPPQGVRVDADLGEQRPARSC